MLGEGISGACVPGGMVRQRRPFGALALHDFENWNRLVRQPRRPEGDRAARRARGPGPLRHPQADQAGRQAAHVDRRGRRDPPGRCRLPGRGVPSPTATPWWPRPMCPVGAAAARRHQRHAARRDPGLLRLCGQPARTGSAPAGQEDHLFRHGAHPAHLAGSGHGRPVEPVGARQLLRRGARHDPHGQRAAQDHLGRRRDRSRQGAGDGAGRRGPGGDRHRPAAGCRGGGLRHPPRHQGAGAIARRDP